MLDYHDFSILRMPIFSGFLVGHTLLYELFGKVVFLTREMCIRDRYYVENGILNWDYTGLTKYYGTWYYVQNGILNWDYTCLLYTSFFACCVR